MIKLTSKKSTTIFIFLLLLLTFLHSFTFKIKTAFAIVLTRLHEIFSFLNRLILVLLPFRNYNKKKFIKDYFNLNTLNYNFKAFPLIPEIENILELNKIYFRTIKIIEAKLVIKMSFINIFHKESFGQVLKLPVYIK